MTYGACQSRSTASAPLNADPKSGQALRIVSKGGKRWLDVGCGTGALSAAILDHCAPGSAVGVEPSEGFLTLAVQNVAGKARFLAGDASALPLASGCASHPR
jgi:ubiquinone/menaquinone biosynthesis C-methylase UbiE